MSYSHQHSPTRSQPSAEESHPTPGSCPGSFKDKKRDTTATSWLTSYTQTSPGYQNFCQDTTCLFQLHQETYSPCQEVSHQFQETTGSWTESGHNPETPGHLSDLQLFAVPLVGWQKYHANLSPRSAKPSLLNSRMNICAALITLRSGKGWRRSSEPDRLSSPPPPPCCRCHRREAHRHEEAKENRQ